ncbi:hypothetical protein AB8880_02040 [Alphaproteobacteria bacterium LSUCC0684]
MPDHYPIPDSGIIQADEITLDVTSKPPPQSDDQIASIAELKEQLIRAEATAAILSAEGNVTLLLHHVTGVLRLTRHGDELAVVARQGEGDIPLAVYIARLKQDPDYAGAFRNSNYRETESGSAASGSGASIIPGSSPTVLDPDNPLKLGSALADIARGSVRVRF